MSGAHGSGHVQELASQGPQSSSFSTTVWGPELDHTAIIPADYKFEPSPSELLQRLSLNYEKHDAAEAHRKRERSRRHVEAHRRRQLPKGFCGIYEELKNQELDPAFLFLAFDNGLLGFDNSFLSFFGNDFLDSGNGESLLP